MAYGYLTLLLCFTSNVWAQGTPTISLVTQTQIRDIGTQADLVCSVTFGQYYPVLWIKLDRQQSMRSLPLSVNAALIIRDARLSVRVNEAAGTYKLSIKDLQETDSGWYQCQVIISVSNKITAEVELQVRRPPVISDNSTTTPASEGEINSTPVVCITGPGLTIDDGTIPYKQKYSYTFKEPGYLNLLCSASGFIGTYELILQNEHGVGARKLFYFSRALDTHSVFHQFHLTTEFRTISCAARDHTTNFTRSSTVDLKYEPDSRTAPSIAINSTPVVCITGPGLTIDDGTIPYKQKYSYTFKEPGYLNLTCSASGLIATYELILQNEHGVGARKLFYFSRVSKDTHHSIFHQFHLTTESRTISCAARDLTTNFTRSSTVDLKYEPDSTTAPSIGTSTISSQPQNQSNNDTKPLDDDISHPQNQSDNMCSEASVDQVRGEDSRLCFEKLLVKALTRSALAAEKEAEAETRIALAAEKQAQAVQQGVAQGVGLLRELVTTLGRYPRV